MIQLTPHMRVLVATESVDFRKGIDGLARIAREELDGDPFSGAVFLFRNRRRTAIKALVYDGQGFWLCHKRFSHGRIRHWPRKDGDRPPTLEVQAVQVLLRGGDFEVAKGAPEWRRVAASS